MKKLLSTTVLALTVSVGAGAMSVDAIASAQAPVTARSPSATATAAATAAVTAEAPTRSADVITVRGGRPAIRRAARIVTMERVYGSNYRIYKARYPHALNWGNDGCSVPFSVPIVDHYKNLFQKSCDRHDFGYRNHGKSGYSRATVDSRFLSNMMYQCVVVYDDWWDLPARGLCYSAADKFYHAVRFHGGGSW